MAEDVTKLSKEDRERALVLLEREKAMKAKDKARMADPVYRAKVAEASKKATARMALTLQKAKAAGITVSDAEVETYLKNRAKK